MTRRGEITLTVFTLLLAVAQVNAAGKEVMIVTSGVNAPDTVYLSRNAATLEQVPLDGVATWIATPVPIRTEDGQLYTTRLPSGRLSRISTGEDTADVGQTIVHRNRIPYHHIEPAISDLKSAQFNRFKSNLIHVITGNALGTMDWFDDQWWEVICHNIGMIAKVAKEGGCRGILIDPEIYAYAWWGYPMLSETDNANHDYRRGNRELYKDRTVDQVAAVVQQRGREFAQAINAEFQDPVIMFFHASGYAAKQIYHDNLKRWSSVKEAPFGLMVPFIDGMLEGSTEQTVIVDCTSQAKWWTERKQLEAARTLIKQDARSLSNVPEIFDRKIRLGFCYRLGVNTQEEAIGERQGVDPPYESWMYDPTSPDSNFFSPEKLEDTLKMALDIGDGYILFWNYRANWWLDSAEAQPADGAPMNERSQWVPRAYWQALKNARNSVAGH